MEELRYDRNSIDRFEEYFATPPAPRSRGRPKKKTHTKKRGRPAKQKGPQTFQAQTMMTQVVGQPEVIDLTAKDNDKLDARLEGALAKRSRTSLHKQRTNWDTPPNFALRKRIADSWTTKSDLYTLGDSFGGFCVKMGIHRNVLKRYMQGKYLKNQSRVQISRGRPTLLKESVMRHLCEGWP